MRNMSRHTNIIAFPLLLNMSTLQALRCFVQGLSAIVPSTKSASKPKRLAYMVSGGAAHILTQVAVAAGKEIYAFTSPGDTAAQKLALELGASWAGDSLQSPPVKLDAAILFAPVGNLIPKALADTDKGGVVICGGIHMSDIPSFPYHLLWEERMIASVANLTRKDGEEFLSLAPKVPVHTETKVYKLNQANKALGDLRNGKINGAAVLAISR
jgi:propanol-preferring alcohol dehydrogenase